jgi:hypothetical protein
MPTSRDPCFARPCVAAGGASIDELLAKTEFAAKFQRSEKKGQPDLRYLVIPQQIKSRSGRVPRSSRCSMSGTFHFILCKLLNWQPPHRVGREVPIHVRWTALAKCIRAIAAPTPILESIDESPLHWIPVHVTQFLNKLLFGIDRCDGVVVADSIDSDQITSRGIINSMVSNTHSSNTAMSGATGTKRCHPN